ncbi:MAG: hypothetical protein ACXVRU_11115, partial [Gaiellaceae bacterium]
FNDPRQVPARIRRRLGNLSSEALAGDDGARGEARRRRTAALVVLPLTIYRGLLRVLAQKRRSLYVEREYERARLPLHTNASGDFTLMLREDWDRTQGYAELEMYSMHIDGLHLYTAHYAGIKARFLPCKIFHIEHGGGFRPEATGDTSLDRTLARRAIPQITNRQLMDYIVEMSSTGAPIAFNRSDWGFAGAHLSETNPLPGRMIVPAEAAHA